MIIFDYMPGAILSPGDKQKITLTKFSALMELLIQWSQRFNGFNDALSSTSQVPLIQIPAAQNIAC